MSIRMFLNCHLRVKVHINKCQTCSEWGIISNEMAQILRCHFATLQIAATQPKTFLHCNAFSVRKYIQPLLQRRTIKGRRKKKKIMYKKMKEERSDLARLGQKTEAEEKKKINSATFVSTFTASGFWFHSFIPFDSFFFICLLLLLLVWCLVNACCAKNTSKQCNIHG